MFSMFIFYFRIDLYSYLFIFSASSPEGAKNTNLPFFQTQTVFNIGCLDKIKVRKLTRKKKIRENVQNSKLPTSVNSRTVAQAWVKAKENLYKISRPIQDSCPALSEHIQKFFFKTVPFYPGLLLPLLPALLFSLVQAQACPQEVEYIILGFLVL